MAGQVYRYPASASVTIAAIGTNGATAPTSSIEVAGVNPSGNLQPLQTDAGGALIVSPLTSASIVTANQGTANTAANRWPVYLTDGTNNNSFTANGLKVDGSAVTQPISAVSLPLPAGASTSALQSSVQSAPGTPQTIALTIQGNASGIAIPTSVAALPLPTGASTAALQSNVQAAAGSSSASVLGIQGVAGGLAVPVSATALPLPTGAATSALQSNVQSAAGTSATTLITVQGSASGVALPVSGTFTLPTGASTAANQTNGLQKTQLVDGSNNVIGSTSNSLNVEVQNPNFTVVSGTPANLKTASYASTPNAGTVTQAAIAIGTTAVRMTVSGSAPSATRSALVFTPDQASGAKFYIGSSTVTSTGATRGIQLVAGQTFTANNDAADYWVISDTAAQTGYVMEQA